MREKLRAAVEKEKVEKRKQKLLEAKEQEAKNEERGTTRTILFSRNIISKEL